MPCFVAVTLLTSEGMYCSLSVTAKTSARTGPLTTFAVQPVLLATKLVLNVPGRSCSIATTAVDFAARAAGVRSTCAHAWPKGPTVADEVVLVAVADPATARTAAAVPRICHIRLCIDSLP